MIYQYHCRNDIVDDIEMNWEKNSLLAMLDSHISHSNLSADWWENSLVSSFDKSQWNCIFSSNIFLCLLLIYGQLKIMDHCGACSKTNLEMKDFSDKYCFTLLPQPLQQMTSFTRWCCWRNNYMLLLGIVKEIIQNKNIC